MGEKLIVGPINKGLKTDREPFVIDNDSFPVLINAYQWRGRIKRKRGTKFFTHLERYFNSTSVSYNTGTTTITLDGSGNGNILNNASWTLQPNASLVPGTVTLVASGGPTTYTDPTMDGYLTPTGTSGPNTINYGTGAILIPAQAGNTVSAIFAYYPDLPVMGLEDFYGNASSQFPGLIGFDTEYSYNILTTVPTETYSVSFYKNPGVSSSLPGYVPKTNATPTSWNGADYQQFYTVNYQGALWATNGVDVPFTGSTIGMQFKDIVTSTVIETGPPAIVSLQITGHGLVVGDFVFVNEVAVSELTGVITAATQADPVVITSDDHGLSTGNTVFITGVVGMTQLNNNTYTIIKLSTNTFSLNGTEGTTFDAYISGGMWTSPASEHPGVLPGINLQTGYVITVTDANNVVVEFPNATVTQNSVGGIAQYLTSRSNPDVDCLRWYDGDPTNGSATNPVLDGTRGWVNFMPPISNLSFAIGFTPAAQYYLVGAKLIFPFKDRMIFFGPVIQSSTSNPIYLNDTIIYSQNGTPYYTSSFTGDPTFATTEFNPVIAPMNQTASSAAYFEDVTGFGGYLSSALDQDINTVGPNEDVLVVGFTKVQTQLIYTGNDIIPFNFHVVNAEFGSGSTFSTVVMDDGVITSGSRGYVMANQVQAQRMDLEIPDEIFEQSLLDNGTERVCAQRDFINEWIYFTYPVDDLGVIYPSQTLQYNYRDNSWAIFFENYTTYGALRQSTQFTWATVGQFYPTWSVWNEPWNSGASNSLQPKVIGGNQQGFVLIRDYGTSEEQSLYIQNIIVSAGTITNVTQASSAVVTVNNNFFVGQQVMIMGVVGMTQLNGNIYSITSASPTSITLAVNSTGFTPYISGGIATPLQNVYSPNHCLNAGDYIIINNALGTIGPVINGNIYSVINVVPNGFSTNPQMPTGYTYYGNGTITRMYIPFIQSKQFPSSWGMSRKTRLNNQQYLFSTTNKSNSQVTLYIYLSQNADNPYNYGPVVPAPNSQNNALVYNTILYTCPEVPIQNCFNISLGTLGNGIVFSFLFNYFELFSIDFTSLVPGSVFIQVGTIATFTDNGNGGFTVTGTGQVSGSAINYISGQVAISFSVPPVSQPTTTNFQYYAPNIQNPTSASQSQIWHRVNTSLLGDSVQVGFTLSDAQMRDIGFNNQMTEIELHAMIFDVTPSSLLA
jgi:hypothetical protein